MVYWALRHVAMIIAIGVLALTLYGRGYLAGPEGGAAAARTSAAKEASRSLAEARRVAPASRSMTLRAGRNGHFMLDARIEGVPVRFLVDTGASAIILRREDADRIGLRLRQRDFTRRFQTANGVVRAAPVVLRAFAIGALSLRNVDAVVNDRPMGVSLLGMDFLRQLDGYEVARDKLILYW